MCGIKLALPFMIPDLVYKFQMMLRKTEVIELKPNAVCTDMDKT
jgi:hypothetical protein